MRIAVIGTGFIGGTLGRSLAGAEHDVTFGSRHPEDTDVSGGTPAAVVSVGDALAQAEVRSCCRRRADQGPAARRLRRAETVVDVMNLLDREHEVTLVMQARAPAWSSCHEGRCLCARLIRWRR
jgi:predicted dinucleotide-binding enzyme